MREVIVVEGKDDVAAVKAAVDAECLITHGHGFGEDVLDQIEAAAARNGIIIMTDPDYAGKRIRERVRQRVPQAKHAYLERRFSMKGGDIGVENASPEAIRRALKKARATLTTRQTTFTMDDLIQNGLEAVDGAKRRRIALGEKLSLGYGNAKQLLARLNDFEISREEFCEAMAAVRAEEGE
ncbi:MAG: ribonuclease M5 [Peptoniphilaceae bacterium]|nr:ribonuclease M5 [Peptoniphilaceae bacterium]